MHLYTDEESRSTEFGGDLRATRQTTRCDVVHPTHPSEYKPMRRLTPVTHVEPRARNEVADAIGEDEYV